MKIIRSYFSDCETLQDFYKKMLRLWIGFIMALGMMIILSMKIG
jgi:hypothetical protein